MNRQTTRWLPVLSVGGILIVAWVAATLASPDIRQLPGIDLGLGPRTSDPPPTADPDVVAPGSDGGAARSFTLPDWVVTAGTVLCLVIVTVIVGGLVWVLLRAWKPQRRRLAVEPAPAAGLTERVDDEVMAAVDAGIEQLADVDADPRRAVIACWVRLERAATAAGTPRELGDSPTDLVDRLLIGHRVSRPVLAGLAAAYREARYATHPIDEGTRRAAIGALRQLRVEIAAARYAPPPDPGAAGAGGPDAAAGEAARNRYGGGRA